jgi:hypothetical protein
MCGNRVQLPQIRAPVIDYIYSMITPQSSDVIVGYDTHLLHV